MLEVFHTHGRKGRSSVVFGLVLVNLVDWNGCVYDRRLDSLLLDDWLDVLVNVVVDVLADDILAGRLRVLNISNITSVLELSILFCKTLPDVVVISVLDLTLLNCSQVVCVLFGEDLLVFDGLDSSVVVILVNFAVYSLGCTFVLGTGNVLICDSWVDSLWND